MQKEQKKNQERIKKELRKSKEERKSFCYFCFIKKAKEEAKRNQIKKHKIFLVFGFKKQDAKEKPKKTKGK